MNQPTPDLVSYSRQLDRMAEAAPDRVAITCEGESVTRAQLVNRADAFARVLRANGVRKDSLVTIALPNSIDWFIAVAAAWRLGATPQPVSAFAPRSEVDAIIELANPAVIVALPDSSFSGRVVSVSDVAAADDNAPLPDVVASAWKVVTSGGSTGRPKLIVAGDPATLDPNEPTPLFRLRFDGCLVMPGPLYHNGPFAWSWRSLLYGNHVVLLKRFDAEKTLAAIAEHRATMLYVVPTMMKRIWRLPHDVRLGYDMSSLEVVWHVAEPCPPWLKEAFIDWLGAERIFEIYAGTEAQAGTVISGTEWLEHRGSVGRPQPGTMSIRDAGGNELPPREVGEVWLRSLRDAPTYQYIGADKPVRPGGWESLGDLGWVDEEGYLYLNDRSADMILTGGANVYPAEVEAAILEHAAVRSCAVIGLPDDDKGNLVHAIVEADEAPGLEQEIRDLLNDRLVRYKHPRSYEFVREPLRDDAGKVRRSSLREARIAGAASATVAAADR